jgi:hypothetical protein
MKSLKSIFIAFTLLLGFNSFAQEVTDATTDIVYENEVWFLEKSQTNMRDWMEDDHMMDLMALKAIEYSKDSNELWGLQRELVKEGDLLLGVPFMSCGIGYRYYKLIQSADNFLLFEALDNWGESDPKVIVLNKR